MVKIAGGYFDRDASTTYHTHDCEQLVAVAIGPVTVDYLDGKKHVLKAGEWHTIPRFSLHKVTTGADEARFFNFFVGDRTL